MNSLSVKTRSEIEIITWMQGSLPHCGISFILSHRERDKSSAFKKLYILFSFCCPIYVRSLSSLLLGAGRCCMQLLIKKMLNYTTRGRASTQSPANLYKIKACNACVLLLAFCIVIYVHSEKQKRNLKKGYTPPTV